MPGRKYISASDYRYGFGAQEKSDEMKGEGNSYTAEFWEYDPRIGRRWNIDPVTKEWESPYAAFNNNPLFFSDPQGLDGEDPQKYKVQKGDNLTNIAKQYNTSVDNLVKWNNIVDRDKINIGQELVISDPTPKKPAVTYETLAAKYPNLIPLTVSGAYSTSLSLYTGSYNTYGSVSSDVMSNLSEEQKQKDFTSNSPKTSGILMWEFLTGTGPSHRSFNQTHAITKEIMWSESARQAIWAMVGDFQNGKYKDGETRGYYAAMAPDKGIGVFESIRRHANAYLNTPATFYRGGMYFRMTKQGNNIVVKVTDAYSVASMITRKAADNISRVPGLTIPLGTTSVEFNFIWENVNFNQKRKE